MDSAPQGSSNHQRPWADLPPLTNASSQFAGTITGRLLGDESRSGPHGFGPGALGRLLMSTPTLSPLPRAAGGTSEFERPRGPFSMVARGGHTATGNQSGQPVQRYASFSERRSNPPALGQGPGERETANLTRTRAQRSLRRSQQPGSQAGNAAVSGVSEVSADDVVPTRQQQQSGYSESQPSPSPLSSDSTSSSRTDHSQAVSSVPETPKSAPAGARSQGRTVQRKSSEERREPQSPAGVPGRLGLGLRDSNSDAVQRPGLNAHPSISRTAPTELTLERPASRGTFSAASRQVAASVPRPSPAASSPASPAAQTASRARSGPGGQGGTPARESSSGSTNAPVTSGHSTNPPAARSGNAEGQETSTPARPTSPVQASASNRRRPLDRNALQSDSRRPAKSPETDNLPAPQSSPTAALSQSARSAMQRLSDRAGRGFVISTALPRAVRIPSQERGITFSGAQPRHNVTESFSQLSTASSLPVASHSGAASSSTEDGRPADSSPVQLTARRPSGSGRAPTDNLTSGTGAARAGNEQSASSSSIPQRSTQAGSRSLVTLAPPGALGLRVTSDATRSDPGWSAPAQRTAASALQLRSLATEISDRNASSPSNVPAAASIESGTRDGIAAHKETGSGYAGRRGTSQTLPGRMAASLAAGWFSGRETAAQPTRYANGVAAAAQRTVREGSSESSLPRVAAQLGRNSLQSSAQTLKPKQANAHPVLNSNSAETAARPAQPQTSDPARTYQRKFEPTDRTATNSDTARLNAGIDTSSLPVGGPAAAVRAAREQASQAVQKAVREGRLASSDRRADVTAQRPASRSRSRPQPQPITTGGPANGHSVQGNTIQYTMHSPASQSASNPAQRYGDAVIQREGELTQLGSAPGQEPPPPSMTEEQLSSLVQALEQRVLREIERRGGRQGGIF